MRSQDDPIVLVRPDDREYPVVSLDQHDGDLEGFARSFFVSMGISSCRFVEPPMPNQDYCCYWSGTRRGIEYQVYRAEGPHTAEYPFWIWVGFEGGGHRDRLTAEVHAAAERLRQQGWRCLVRGYISATGETAL